MTSRARHRLEQAPNLIAQARQSELSGVLLQLRRDATRVANAQAEAEQNEIAIANAKARAERRMEKAARKAANKAAGIALAARMLVAKERPPPMKIVFVERVEDAVRLVCHDGSDVLLQNPELQVQDGGGHESAICGAGRGHALASEDADLSATAVQCSDGSVFVWKKRTAKANLWTFSLGSWSTPAVFGAVGVRDFIAFEDVAESLSRIIHTWSSDAEVQDEDDEDPATIADDVEAEVYAEVATAATAATAASDADAEAEADIEADIEAMDAIADLAVPLDPTE